MTEMAAASQALQDISLSTPAPPDVSGDVTMAEVVPGAPAPIDVSAVENTLPADACETLYIQNLNETVKIEGLSISISLIALLSHN